VVVVNESKWVIIYGAKLSPISIWAGLPKDFRKFDEAYRPQIGLKITCAKTRISMVDVNISTTNHKIRGRYFSDEASTIDSK
jgi:hypothetical protein